MHAHINETQTGQKLPLSAFSFLRRLLLASSRLYQCKFRAVGLQYSREWSSNKISKLFFTEFNVLVNLIGPVISVGDKPGNQTCHEIFMHNFRFKKNVMLIYVSCETPEQISDSLYF